MISKTRFILPLLFWLIAVPFLAITSAQASTVYRPPKIEFSKKEIKVAGRLIRVEIADTEAKRERGLMYRESLAENTGMLFIFDSEQPMAFWMKNTLIPLSIGYFGADRKLVDVQEMEPSVMAEVRPKTYPSRKPAKYALEMPKGWFRQHAIKTGALLSLDAK